AGGVDDLGRQARRGRIAVPAAGMALDIEPVGQGLAVGGLVPVCRLDDVWRCGWPSSGQKRELSGVMTSSISRMSPDVVRPNSNLVSAMMMPCFSATSRPLV